jgi:hypothetical protein
MMPRGERQGVGVVCAYHNVWFLPMQRQHREAEFSASILPTTHRQPDRTERIRVVVAGGVEEAYD